MSKTKKQIKNESSTAAFLRSYSLETNNNQRDIYRNYGWDLLNKNVTRSQDRQFNLLYQNFGVAKGIIDLLPQKIWSNEPEVRGRKSLDAGVEPTDDNIFNQVKMIDDFLNIFYLCRDAEIIAGYQHYCLIVMMKKDENTKDLIIPLDELGKWNLKDVVLKVVPSGHVTKTYSNKKIFDKIEKYGIGSARTAGNREAENYNFDIHPSRCIHIAENLQHRLHHGLPTIKSIYTELMDLLKIKGAIGEINFQNASNTILAKRENPGGALTKEEKDTLALAVSATANKSNSLLFIDGVEISKLHNTPPPQNVKEVMEAFYNNIATTLNIPVNTLLGTQTGVLAGNKDADAFKSRILNRRETFSWHKILKPLLYKFVEVGLLNIKNDFLTVDFGDLDREDPQAKAERISKEVRAARDLLTIQALCPAEIGGIKEKLTDLGFTLPDNFDVESMFSVLEEKQKMEATKKDKQVETFNPNKKTKKH